MPPPKTDASVKAVFVAGDPDLAVKVDKFVRVLKTRLADASVKHFALLTKPRPKAILVMAIPGAPDSVAQPGMLSLTEEGQDIAAEIAKTIAGSVGRRQSPTPIGREPTDGLAVRPSGVGAGLRRSR